MEDFIYNGMKMRLFRSTYQSNGALYIGAEYYDEDYNEWLLYDDVTVNIDYLDTYGKDKHLIAVNDYEELGHDIIDMIKDKYGIVFFDKIMQGFGSFTVYLITKYEQLLTDIKELEDNDDFIVQVYDIDWDTDDMLATTLPTNLNLSFEQFSDSKDIDEFEEKLSDYLSDNFGYCHNGFKYEIKDSTGKVVNFEELNY